MEMANELPVWTVISSSKLYKYLTQEIDWALERIYVIYFSPLQDWPTTRPLLNGVNYKQVHEILKMKQKLPVFTI